VTRDLRLLTGLAVVLLAAGTAHAQSAPTCSFNPDTHVLTVGVNGLTAAITRTAGGQIRLNGADCTGATVTSTDLIQVNGGDLVDYVTVTGDYTQGFTTEGVGTSEIEWVFNLGISSDNLKITYPGVPATVMFTANGIDVANDGDEDMTTAGDDKVRIYTGTGTDTIDGSAQPDWLDGQGGNDTMYGADGADKLYGGVGNDVYYGDAGNDVFWQESTADGDDDFFGGADTDTVNYQKRTNAVTVTLGNGLADDGETGEFDAVDIDVERATGGGGADVLVGSSAVNLLTGNNGDDELYGGGGNDTLKGGAGGPGQRPSSRQRPGRAVPVLVRTCPHAVAPAEYSAYSALPERSMAVPRWTCGRSGAL
jgi:Ca2+-binding RTX toxin-like protein